MGACVRGVRRPLSAATVVLVSHLDRVARAILASSWHGTPLSTCSAPAAASCPRIQTPVITAAKTECRLFATEVAKSSRKFSSGAPIFSVVGNDTFKFWKSRRDLRPCEAVLHEDVGPVESATDIIDGKATAKDIRGGIGEEVAQMKEKVGKVPGLAVVLVGNRTDLEFVHKVNGESAVHGILGIGVGRSIPQLWRQTGFGSSSSVDVCDPDPPSNVSEDLSNERVGDSVLSSSPVADLPSSNFPSSRGTCSTSLSSFAYLGSVRCNPVLSPSESVHVFNSPFRVSVAHFATLREVWQDDKEDEEAVGHGKRGASEPWSQREDMTQTIDTGREADSEKLFVRDKAPETETLRGNGKAINNSQETQLCSAREEAKMEVGWSEMGWNHQEVVNWPNAISMARLLSGPLLSWMILHQLWSPAFVGLLLAGISDWLDGYVARKMNINSVLGSYLDPIADKFLVGSVAISMAYMGLLHPALVGLIVARDAVLMGGAFVYRAYTLRWQWNDWQEFFRINMGGAEKVEPLFISKVNTVFQIALVGVALLQPALSIEDTYSIVPVLSLSVVATTSASWAAYAYMYWRNPQNLAALRRVTRAPSPKTPQRSS